MLNQVILVGRIKEIKGKDLSIVVTDNVKNKKGEYDNYTIHTIIKAPSIVKSVHEYCKKGDIVGIKGKLTANNRIIVEKLTFLSSSYK